MLIYQPPLRTGFYRSAMFLRSTKNNNGINNYVHISYQGSSKINKITKINYIVNDDKVSDTSFKGKDTIIPVENKKLIEIIDYSFKTYERTYLFPLKFKNSFFLFFLNFFINFCHFFCWWS